MEYSEKTIKVCNQIIDEINLTGKISNLQICKLTVRLLKIRHKESGKRLTTKEWWEHQANGELFEVYEYWNLVRKDLIKGKFKGIHKLKPHGNKSKNPKKD